MPNPAATKPIDLAMVQTKLASARTRLILEKPFLGALVLRLPLTPASADWCRTTATDARAFYYNPEFIAALSLDETQFMLAHEALHCALSHFARRQHRVKHRWDLACDYAINPLLVDEGLRPPPNALLMPMYKGMTAEEIYPLISDNDQSQTLDTHAYDRASDAPGQHSGTDERDLERQQRAGRSQAEGGEGGAGTPTGTSSGTGADGDGRRDTTGAGSGAAPASGDQSSAESQPTTASAEDRTGEDAQHGSADMAPPPLRADEQETLAVQWQSRMAGAAQQALQAGKLGGAMRRMLDHLLQPQLPWRVLLARYLSACAREDYSWSRPSRREGEYLMPSLRSQQLDLIVALDTSGSIKDSEVQAFIDEIDALKGQVRARVTLLPCDAQLCDGAPFRFEPWEQFCRPRHLAGGGGTNFRPVFDWVERQGERPDLLVYFTDANGTFPAREPDFPVIWLVKGRTAVPWGQRIQLN